MKNKRNTNKKITGVLINKKGIKLYQYDDKDVHSKFGVIKKQDIAEIKEKNKTNATKTMSKILNTLDMSKTPNISLDASNKVYSNTKEEFNVVPVSFIDKYLKLKKGAQTIPLKDLGFIVSYTGIGKNSIVYEAGAGSGGSTLFFANIVKKVFSFDIREDHFNIVKENINFVGVKNVSLKLKDISKSFGKENVADLILLDLPEPWIAIDSSFKTMKLGAWLVVYSPNITQISKFIEIAKNKKGLLYDTTKEILTRDWKIEGRICHPHGKNTIGHSAFLAFFRKINN